MDTLTYLSNKFFNTIPENLNDARQPLEIANVGRDDLARLFAELNFTKGAEIGVEQGVYSETLLSANKDLYLYCVDAWTAYKGYRDHTRQEKLDKFYQTTLKRLESYAGRFSIVPNFSMAAVNLFEDNSLDFVYIDANHDFLNVTQDIFYWSKKVRKGGIVAGHDYVKRKNEAAHVHVKQVLHGYTDAYNIRPWFVLGRDAKIEGEIRDDTRSWFFVKQ